MPSTVTPAFLPEGKNLALALFRDCAQVAGKQEQQSGT